LSPFRCVEMDLPSPVVARKVEESNRRAPVFAPGRSAFSIFAISNRSIIISADLCKTAHSCPTKAPSDHERFGFEGEDLASSLPFST
jgi:hypothetical protein